MSKSLAGFISNDVSNPSWISFFERRGAFSLFLFLAMVSEIFSKRVDEVRVYEKVTEVNDCSPCACIKPLERTEYRAKVKIFFPSGGGFTYFMTKKPQILPKFALYESRQVYSYRHLVELWVYECHSSDCRARRFCGV
jgi:hypothetical protein